MQLKTDILNHLALPRQNIYRDSLATRLLCYFTCGSISLLAFAPWHAYAVIWFTLVPLLHLCQHPSAKERFLGGFAFGLGIMAVGLSWLPGSIANFFQASSIFSFLSGGFVLFYLSLFPALFCWLAACFKPRYQLFTAPALWLLFEVVRDTAFEGLPWLKLGLSQTDGPFSLLAPLIGEYGLSAWIIFINGLWLSLLHKKRTTTGVGVLAIITLTTMANLKSQVLSWTTASALFQVSLVQPNVAQHKKWDPQYRAAMNDQFNQLTQTIPNNSDLVIWPETALPIYANRFSSQHPTLLEQLNTNNTALIIGLIENTIGSNSYNSFYIYQADQLKLYRKTHLVPFAETLPAPTIIKALPLSINTQDLHLKGKTIKPIPINELTIGPSICWEALFSHHAAVAAFQGAEVLVNIANEAWTDNEVALARALQASRMRSLETGKPLLRSANTANSAVIDPSGRVIKRTGVNQEAVINASLRAFSGLTPYVKLYHYRDFIIIALCSILLAVLIRPHKNN